MVNYWIWRLLGVSALLLAGFTTQAQATASIDDYAMKAESIGPNMWVVLTPSRDFPNAENKGWNSNAAFIDAGEGVLVFDTGSSETIGRALRRVIESTVNKPIRWVINSHSHGDHWLGNNAFAGEGVEVLTSERALAEAKKMGAEWVDRFNQLSEGATGNSTLLYPNSTVAEPASRRFGNVQVDILFSGDAHSPGDIVFWLPQQGVILAGDTMFIDRTPATFDSNVQNWIKFLSTLEALNPKTVVPGHGPLGGKQDVANLRMLFERMWAVIAAGYDEGLSDFEIAKQVRERLAELEPTFPGLGERAGNMTSHIYLQVEEAMF